MDIKKVEDKVDQADSLLTKLKTFLKKHWGILLLLVILYGVYKFCVLVGEEMDKQEEAPIEIYDTPGQAYEDSIEEAYHKNFEDEE